MGLPSIRSAITRAKDKRRAVNKGLEAFHDPELGGAVTHNRPVLHVTCKGMELI